MPLYRCSSPAACLNSDQKQEIAEAVTRIHCDVTGAPESFVHVMFFDAGEPADSIHKIQGTIRAGRTDEQKKTIWDDIADSFSKIAEVPRDCVSVSTADIPSSWSMEGGRVLPEPGQEAEWLAALEH